MRSINRLFWINFLLLVITSSCTKNTLTLPDPAPSLEGTYQAVSINKPFPIQGETVKLSIKSLSKDSVSVSLVATVNGQPADSITYNKARISQLISTVNVKKGCVSYSINLTSAASSQSDFLRMTCTEENVISYYYTPAGQNIGTITKFKKI
ncbi:hypothetical protein [Spirosoma radiotolerans]|uniref:Lipocalin-like domain-containing protein n=1 Tax=Spirosoma radiotolerans TaxID=1379870 RepID=A0A0E3ZWT2_9BACT|nr:hypothetical protein [Spirosoma radiotolerans]AKD56748.1 hypothetical protein SD10_19440 [Spirosoma radiotolerans]